MDIEFDPAKREQILLHRGLAMSDCARVFERRCLTFPDLRENYGEERFITIGHFHGRMVVLSWTVRGNVRRIISMRKANEREVKLYAPRLV